MSPPSVVASTGYRSALTAAVVAARPDRAFVRVSGKDPAGMLKGILTNRVPEGPAARENALLHGRGGYSAVLTPKGRMVSDLRVVNGPRPQDGLLLDLPAQALGGLLAHLSRFLPPRLARATDETARIGALTVAGPRAAALLTREALGLRVDEHELEVLEENGWVWADLGGAGILVVRSAELGVPAYDVIADASTTEALGARLMVAGAEPLEAGDRETLRVEAGRPAWGSELDEDTLPPEAGIDARAIDHTKGCYTGQEVIVRIRDRGHVNRYLRGLKLGGATAGPKTQLWMSGRDAPVGTITVAVASPRADETLGLGYVRREIDVPGELRAGGPEGPVVKVVALEGRNNEEWWRG